jgi:phospholipid/cholesterol/gamma-HCH transport system substrate-binding protein
MRRAVGVFFFLGLLLLGALTLFVDPEVNPFSRGGSYFYIVVPDASGLEVGGRVRLAGLDVGRVTAIKMQESDVRVEFLIQDAYHLREDSLASLAMTSMLGNGRTLSLTLGSPAAKALPGGARGSEATRLENVELPVALQDVIHKADQLFAGLKDVGPTIREAAENIRNITKKVYDDLRAALAKLNDGLDSIRNIAAKAEKGEGSFGKFLTDETLYNNLRDASKDIVELGRKLNSTEGTLGRLINDQALYEDIRKATTSMAAVMQKIDKGEGTLGRLINDESLYVEARRFLKEAREAIEDSREQAPITAFSSVIFAAFQ